MEIRGDTEELFIQDKAYVVDYMRKRGLSSPELERIINDYPFGLVRGASFFANGEQFEISHFLSKSEVPGYDIIKANEMLGISETDDVAFAVVLGDDALCYNTKNKCVYVWLMQSGDGEKIEVSKDLEAFLLKFESKTEGF